MNRRQLLTGAAAAVAAAAVPAPDVVRRSGTRLLSFLAPGHVTAEPCLLTADDGMVTLYQWSRIKRGDKTYECPHKWFKPPPPDCA